MFALPPLTLPLLLCAARMRTLPPVHTEARKHLPACPAYCSCCNLPLDSFNFPVVKLQPTHWSLYQIIEHVLIVLDNIFNQKTVK